jgi:hypothetical protein
MTTQTAINEMKPVMDMNGLSLCFKDPDGKLHATFVYDGAGRLVYRDPETGCADSMIPYAVSVVVPSDESDAPWSVSEEYVLERTKEWQGVVQHGRVTGKELYPEGKPDAWGFPFVPHCQVDPDLSKTGELIFVYESATDPAKKKEVLGLLRMLGVYHIPRIKQLNPLFHEIKPGAQVTKSFQVFRDGFMTCRAVIEKTLIIDGAVQ